MKIYIYCIIIVLAGCLARPIVIKPDSEQNLEQTSAVGLYPHRASPYDVLDMAGNVWEWCLNKYDKPDYIQADNSGDMRVVRGGSWSDYPEYARCANRTRGNPDYRYGSRGFRVVCSSPFTDH